MIIITQFYVCDLCGHKDEPFVQEISATQSAKLLGPSVTINADGLYVDLCKDCTSKFIDATRVAVGLPPRQALTPNAT